jgi:hypothetical protein
MRALPGPNGSRRHHQADINGVRYQFPVCSICDRDVEAFAWSDHFAHDSSDPLRTFFVSCHGEVEHVTLRLSEMKSGEMTHFRIEHAFRPLAPELDFEEHAARLGSESIVPLKRLGT